MVRERRLAAGLTQQQLAETAGVGVGTVRDLEQDRTVRPHANSMQRLAAALDLNPRQAGGPAWDHPGDPDGGQGVSDMSTGRGGEPATTLRLRTLGPLEAWRDGVPVELGAVAQRAVLGLLALQPNTALPRTAIIEALWGDDRPATAVTMVQSYVSRLRRLLDPGRVPQAPGPGLRLVRGR